MRPTDDADLAAVRETVTAIAGAAADPSDTAVARVRSRVALGRTHPGPGHVRWHNWVTVPAAAATVVAVTLVATLALRPGSDQGVRVGGPPPTQPVPSTPAPATGGPTSPTGNVITDLGRIEGRIPLAEAVRAMADASEGATQVTLGPGQLLYARTDRGERLDGTMVTSVHEMWINPDGVVPVRIVIDGREMEVGPPTPAGPNLENPNPRWLARLTTDPDALYAKFAAINAGTKMGGAHYVPKQVASAFRTYGPLLSPRLRAAFFKVLGKVPGGRAHRIVLSGHTYYGFVDITAGAQWEKHLLCDPETGQVVGERYGTSDQIALWHYAVVNGVNETG
jgi:hypothetical protein